MLFQARDRLHQLEGSFTIMRCTCGFQATMPQPKDPGSYYPTTYYAYSTPGPAPFYGSGIKGLVRTIVLFYHLGYRYGTRAARLPEQGWPAQLLRAISRPLARRSTLVFGPGPLPKARPGGRVLDIGCGSGIWLQRMRALGWDAEGVELSPTGAQAAQAAGLKVRQGTLEEAALADASYDVIRLWHTLEHVPNPLATLNEVARLLKPGGELLLGVPNAGGWLARLWGTYWFDLDVPRHLWHFTPATLRSAVEHASLRVSWLGYGFYGGLSSVLSWLYRVEARRGYSLERRDRVERWVGWVRQAALARPVRGLFSGLERTNHLELRATKPDGL